jgi:hypothetical protein
MAFFKSKPNVGDAEKARIEFHLQQIAECVGFERILLPVVDQATLIDLAHTSRSPEPIVEFVGKHLTHDVSQLRVTTDPQELKKCGGGG